MKLIKMINAITNKFLLLYIYIIDQIFIYRLNNPIVGRRNLINNMLSKASSLKSISTKKINGYLAQEIIKEYSIRNNTHYKQNGRGLSLIHI